MPLPTYLVKRGDTFYYRAKVPFDLVDRLQRREVWVSLRTTDRRNAERRLADVHVCQLRSYDRLRNGISDTTVELPSFVRPRKVAKTPSERTIDDLMVYWASQSNKRPRTLLDAKTAVKRLRGVLGTNSAMAVTKLQAVAFKDSLIAEGLAHATIVKNLGLVKSMFELAKSNGMVSANPFADLKLVKPSRVEKPRLSFSQADLDLVFQSPVFTKGQRPLGGAGEAAYWIPLIALMTGMRLEEIGQLRNTDIKQNDDIWFIDLDYTPEQGRWLKNDSSRRQIPIHQCLLDLGFLGVVSNAPGRLFPLLRSAGNRQLTASWSQWFGLYLRRDIALTDTRKTFHSFRHTFKDMCRVAGVPKDIHDRLTGHKSSDVGDGYGAAQYPLRPLADAVQKITIPLDISSLVQSMDAKHL
jgi:integrase